jgi:uncharacterized protein with HEPN domain
MIDRVYSHTEGDLSWALEDGPIRDAVLYNLTIVGEAAKHVSEETRRRAPEVNWSGAAGLRDVLIHRYHRTDMTVIAALDDALRTTKAAVERLLRELDG